MKRVRVRALEEGLRAALFDLEADIMGLVWSQGWEEFSIAQVHTQLQQARPLAYTTVMTTVRRLYDKGLLARRKDGRRHLYAPTRSREAFELELARRVSPSLADLSSDGAVALLVDRVSEADVDELARLEALIRERRRKLER